MKRAASENGVSEYEKATSKERFTLAEVPAASPSAPLPAGASAIPTASPASPVAPLPPLPEGELVTLGDREIADNLRFEQLHDHLALQGIDMSRASWHWPESFFKSEARGRPSQATRAKELLCAFYAGHGSAIVADFYENAKWFEIWEETDVDRDRFVYRKGDILVFAGHSMIVTGANLYDEVVVSQMSWNRTKQAYDMLRTPFRYDLGWPDYGVTRDKLVQLRDRNLVSNETFNVFGYPYRIHRLKRYLMNYADLQVFDQEHELPSEGRTYTEHTVKAGETLTKIADKYGVTLDELIAANGIRNPDLIYADDVLIIP